MLATWFTDKLLNPLGLFGLAAQGVFMLRFVVQWFASERRGRSYVPISFWYLSLVGGLLTCIYAFMREDPVFTLAQLLGVTIYVRNLVLIHSRHARHRRRALGSTPPEATVSAALVEPADP